MKRQIISVHFEYLRNETHVELSKAVITAIDRHNPAQFGFGAVYAGYRQLVATEVSLLDIMRKGGYMIEIQEQDRVRDNLFRGLSDAVKSGLNHFDAVKCEAAWELSALFDRYNSIAARTLDEETASLDALLSELSSGTAAASVQTLGLTDWTGQLALENGEFKFLMHALYGEIVQRPPSLRVYTVRLDVDKALRTIFNFLDIVSTVHGLPAYELLVNELNTVFDRYRNIPVQQAGARKKDGSNSRGKSESSAGIAETGVSPV
ncbi:MAG: DUF6261 family protein [Tannerella sp.]|jgi:hypothetical protein|nr:DUF6261 family protein [Tannerella sp.]